jgi:hypothetical protein
MGFIKITEITSEGVTTKDLSELTEGEHLDLELDTYFPPKEIVVYLFCSVCKVQFRAGNGYFQCEKHRN